MEGVKSHKRIINIIRSPLALSPRNDVNRGSNIFSRNDLESLKMISLDKKYSFVGLKEMKDFIKKSKKGNFLKKQGNHSSLGSYTMKSNEF